VNVRLSRPAIRLVASCALLAVSVQGAARPAGSESRRRREGRESLPPTWISDSGYPLESLRAWSRRPIAIEEEGAAPGETKTEEIVEILYQRGWSSPLRRVSYLGAPPGFFAASAAGEARCEGVMVADEVIFRPKSVGALKAILESLRGLDFRPQPPDGWKLDRDVHRLEACRVGEVLPPAFLIEIPIGPDWKEALDAVPRLVAFLDGPEAADLVEYAQPNYLYSPQEAVARPKDRYFTSQWGLCRVQAPRAWGEGHRGSDKVVVAVVDSGYETKHKEFPRANLWTEVIEEECRHGKSFCRSCRDLDPWNLRDPSGHGTHMAGAIGAAVNNDCNGAGTCYGVAGINWYVQLMMLRFMFENGGTAGKSEDAAAAICFAADHGAHIINASWGGRLWRRPTAGRGHPLRRQARSSRGRCRRQRQGPGHRQPAFLSGLLRCGELEATQCPRCRRYRAGRPAHFAQQLRAQDRGDRRSRL
jgi:hypothetical protein